MHKITPHLWYDKEAVEAAELYASALPDSRINHVTRLYETPSGDCDIVSFELCGQPFMSISAGPYFKFTPAVSFMVACETDGEVDALWNRLSEGGKVLVPLDSYPFSQRYGWTEDRYGLSWQIGHADQWGVRQKITPTLMFAREVCGKAEEAINHYTSVFPNSRVEDILRYGEGEEPDKPGSVKYAGFTLEGQNFGAMDSAQAHDFTFNEAISFMVNCENQQEIDRYWSALSAVPESEQCGWLKDKFGVSWQVVPAALTEMLANGTEEQVRRVTEAFLKMKKFDLEELERAYEGTPVGTGGQG